MKKSLKELEKKREDMKAKSELIEDLEIKMADYQDRIRQIEDIVTERRYTLTQHEGKRNSWKD